MRDITHSVLSKKTIPKIKNSFFSPKKFITALAVALGIAGITLPALASTGGTIDWTGQGVTNGSLDTTQCDENNTPYLLWVFTGGSNVTSATITITNNSSTVEGPTAMTQQGGGSFHYTSGFYNLSTVGASVTYVGTASNPQLVISHGCPGGTSTTTTTLKDASNSTVTEGASVPLGTVMHDTATVTLTPSAIPTGSVAFRFYTSVSACTADTTFTGGTSMGSAALDGNNPGVATSTTTSALTPGTYAFKAKWPGQTGYTGSMSSCETFTVTQAQLTVTTNIHDSNHNNVTSVDLGSVVHDTASLSGAVSGFSTPAITFTFYNNATCSGDGTSVTNTGADEGNSALVRSVDSAALAAGSYAYKASVAGNSNYLGDSSDCEPLTVNKANLSLTTDIHNAAHAIVTSVNAGSTVHDQANVGDIVTGFAPTQNVSFTFFTNATCSSTGTSAGSQPIVNGIAHPSSSEGPLNAGSYAFQANYPGDSNYNSITSACEPLTVNKVTPTIATTPNPTTGLLGVVLNDSATVSGGYNPTGSVTFNLYGPSDPTCSGTPAYTFTDTTSPYATSPGFTSNAVGTWRWTATYNGDINNNTVSSGCNDELVTITQPLWCSPGFWLNNAVKWGASAWPVLTSTKYNSTVYPTYGPHASGNPSLLQVLQSPGSYFSPQNRGAGFNGVADYLAHMMGWTGTQSTGENCPLDQHGNLTLTTLVI